MTRMDLSTFSFHRVYTRHPPHRPWRIWRRIEFNHTTQLAIGTTQTKLGSKHVPLHAQSRIVSVSYTFRQTLVFAARTRARHAHQTNVGKDPIPIPVHALRGTGRPTLQPDCPCVGLCAVSAAAPGPPLTPLTILIGAHSLIWCACLSALLRPGTLYSPSSLEFPFIPSSLPYSPPCRIIRQVMWISPYIASRGLSPGAVYL